MLNGETTMRRLFLLLLISLTVSIGLPVNIALGQSETKAATDSVGSQTAGNLRDQVKQWQKSIRDAGKLFKDDQLEQSAELINAVQNGVLNAAQGADKKQIRALKPVYSKLA